METDQAQKPLNWFGIWSLAFLRPTLSTFSRIISQPKASIKWGVFWAGITALVIWMVGPQRTLWWGMAADQFGMDAAGNFLAIGTLAFPIFGVILLLVNAAISHGLSRLFAGAGTFRQLVFCWGVMQLPFILFSGLAINILPYAYGLLPSSAMNFSVMRTILLISMLLAAAGILYLFYAQVVALSAVEKFGVGKGFGIMILLAVILGLAGAALSYGFQTFVMRTLYYLAF